MEEYDVVIVGGSFAGLAVASELSNWKVLIIDEKPIGEGIKSTCGTVLSLVEELRLMDTVRQIHKKFIFHTEDKEYCFDLQNHPFCVIDEEKFNKELFLRSKAKFLQARLISNTGNTVKTNQGEFSAKILVDASGPRAVLTYKVEPNFNKNLFFGIETLVDYKDENLHYYYLPKKFKKGVFWIFPQGDTSRIGLGSYQAEMHLEEKLEEFLAKINLKKNNLHGGFGTHKLRGGSLNNIFVVGDAAGQCIPLTAEGIRPAIVFGTKAGEIINKILSGKIAFREGLDSYRKFVDSKRIDYLFYKFVQEVYIRLPIFLVNLMLKIATNPKITNKILNKYFGFLSYKEENNLDFVIQPSLATVETKEKI